MPQVRFERPEKQPEEVGVSEPAVTQSAVPTPMGTGNWQESDQRIAGRERGTLLRAAFNAAVIAAILSIVRGGFIIGMPLGGFLAVLFYRRRSWRAEPSLADGFRLGVLAGLFASAILGIVVAADASVSNHGAEFRQEFQQQLIERSQTMQSRTSDPEQQQAIQQAVEYLKTSQGMTAAVIFAVVIMTVIFVALSGLGGMISASLLRRKGPRG